jgi:hypothetical protein
VQPGGIFSAWPTERLVGFFRELNGCAGTGDRSSVPGTARNTIELNRSTKCARAPVAFYRVVGGDHGAAWEANFGPALLDFFREQTRDEPALAARPAPTEAPARPQAAANAPFSNIAYRRQDGPTLVTGTLRRISAEEWLETNTRGSRWTFSTTTENESEIVLYDISRDTHVRADLPAQKLYVRKGTSPWAPLADIVRAEK